MISQEQADAALVQAARELMEMSYDELALLDNRLPRSPEDEWRELPSIAVGGEKFHVHLLIGKIGWFRRRFSVEMVLNSEDGTQWPRVPCVYFERFRSGRLYVARTHR